MEREHAAMDGDTSIGRAAEPERSLTPALAAVLDGIVEGLTNAQIAARRGTSARTVANQVAALLRRYRVASRFALPGASAEQAARD